MGKLVIVNTCLCNYMVVIVEHMIVVVKTLDFDDVASCSFTS